MKKLAPILSVTLLACAASSCSSSNDTASDEPELQQSSAAETSPEGAESSEESPAPITSGEKEEDDSGMQQKDKEAFIATNAPSHATSTVYGVSSPDDRVACTVTEDKGLLGCNVNFADPPLYPATGLPTWLSNSVNFDQDKGFYPNLKLGGESAPPTTLEAGSTVSMAGVTFEAASEDEFTVTIDGHHFTVKDQGQYFSDTFPPKPDAEGHAMIGTVCGDAGNGEYVYAKSNDTNCARAMEVIDYYKNYDFAPMEGGNRGYLMEDDFSCSYNADAGWPDQPEYRWLGCSIEGAGEVVVLDSNARALISAQG
ncbi:hypothetical protein QP922_07385 [Corynebacterium sp. MSK218]|uniref:hypothetical protein n=1 Tax=Corynebacterium sp. MSK218 TaxID=3050218 RepID=UPI00254D0147|nr:hypothetical protein [Corynebacterium sp. MSK218]MDK8763640.1 hypothetical protein [Corynebacterium sp. MSK218]